MILSNKLNIFAVPIARLNLPTEIRGELFGRNGILIGPKLRPNGIIGANVVIL